MWTDFSEVRLCPRVDFGERDEHERAWFFLPSFLLFVAGGDCFLLSSTSTPHSNLQPQPFPKKKKKNSKQCIRDTDDPRKCKALRDDYLECLHHRKEIARLNTVYREQKKADAAAAAGGDKGGAAAAEKKH